MKTTMKVESHTRDIVRQLSAEKALTYDEVIQLGMAALRREARREQMRRESTEATLDQADLDEAGRVLADMEAWGRVDRAR